MGLLDSAKNILAMVKKYNDIELNQQIIDLTQQSLDLINENVRLTQENEELKKSNDLESRIIRHEQPFITIKDEDAKVCYCAACWGNSQKLVQMNKTPWDNGYTRLTCIVCKNRFDVINLL